MNHRAIEIVNFLVQTGWDGAQQTPLQADFSSRRFARLERDGGLPKNAVLMDADPDQKTGPFVAVAKILRAHDISAPEIYAAHVEHGLVLMEDFGDRNFGRMLDDGADAGPLYRRAADVLIRLHRSFDPAGVENTGLPVFDAQLFAAQAELFLDAYFILIKERAANAGETESFRAAWATVLGPVDQFPRTLMLRDFMPDNVMDVPDRAAWRSAGLLDFQDAGFGPAAYDLASLCECVRRDCGRDMLDGMIDYYHAQAASKMPKDALRAACRILSAQRHTRVLGIVARRALQTGQNDKLAYAPRLWTCLERLWQDETMKPVRQWMDEHFPPQDRSGHR